jgi:carbon-monoxide dehydrogenase medium subunit
MSLTKFDYYAPQSIEEALRLLLEIGDESMLMAGGTDILMKMRRRAIQPKAIVGLKQIAGLEQIAFDRKKGLTIGATALLSAVASHPDILKYYPAVAYAASQTANVQIRNMGTVAGNLCNAAPSADNAPTLKALGAHVMLTSAKGQRKLSLEDFFKGPGITAMEKGEILTAIEVPPPLAYSGAAYRKLATRGKLGCSAVGVGAMVIMEGAVCREVKIVLGSVAPIPMRAKHAEDVVRGVPLSAELLAKAGLCAYEECRPISDVRATAEYRREVVAVLTARAIEEAVKSASA